MTVLGVVKDHPMHGYAIADLLDKGIGWTLGLKKSAVYAILRRFEKQGWVSQETSKETNYPERRIYMITEHGQSALADSLAMVSQDPASPLLPLSVLLIQLDSLADAERARALNKLLKWRVERLREMESLESHDGLAGQALELMQSHLQLEIDCINKILADP